MRLYIMEFGYHDDDEFDVHCQSRFLVSNTRKLTDKGFLKLVNKIRKDLGIKVQDLDGVVDILVAQHGFERVHSVSIIGTRINRPAE